MPLFPATTTSAFTNFNLKGISGSLTTLKSATAGTAALLAITNKTSGLDYLTIKDISSSNKTPVTFWAGANSTNVSNNTGIAFANGTSQQAHVLTSGTSFTTPSDWNNASNNIYLYGGGGGGAGSSYYITGFTGAAGGGGGGGGFTLLTNQTLSGAIAYTIGAGGTAGLGSSGVIATAGDRRNGNRLTKRA